MRHLSHLNVGIKVIQSYCCQSEWEGFFLNFLINSIKKKCDSLFFLVSLWMWKGEKNPGNISDTSYFQFLHPQTLRHLFSTLQPSKFVAFFHYPTWAPLASLPFPPLSPVITFLFFLSGCLQDLTHSVFFLFLTVWHMQSHSCDLLIFYFSFKALGVYTTTSCTLWLIPSSVVELGYNLKFTIPELHLHDKKLWGCIHTIFSNPKGLCSGFFFCLFMELT